ncbi:MAG TPA: ACT domain-containing protein [Acidimicrobiia bacterium]|nr:ACT domain-containing protein [Acidimicrobiia bacterium]
MTEFVVRLDNRPGSLARLTELLAEAGVNIDALAAWGHNGDGVVRLIVDQPEACARVLDEAGLGFEERTVLTAFLSDLPGELARVTRAIADAEVNIEAIFILGTHADGLEVALAVDDPETAEPILPVRGSLTGL